MRAVNLIPVDERKGAGGAAGRSGGAAYILLGALAVLVVLAGIYASTGKTIDDRKAELARTEANATAAEARAAALAPYTAFNQLRTQRTQTVRSIASSRFDWSHALGELARVIPADVQLTSLRGTVSNSSGTGGGGAAAGNSLRGAIDSPALEMTGCAPTHVGVARMIVRMRLIDGVKRVSLQDASKSEAKGAAGSSGSSAGSSGGTGCGAGDKASTTFNLVVFLNPIAPPGTPATAPAAAAAPATGAQQPAAAVTPTATATPGATK